MKILSSLCAETKKHMKPDQAYICEYVNTPSGIIALEYAVLSSEKTCDWCSGRECYCPLVDPKQSGARSWLCANSDCEVYKTVSHVKMSPSTARSCRAILWPSFCEINGIGDEHHDVRFEEMKQSEAKVSYLLKFASSPRSIIFMRGEPGTGKTYASMAVCEFYTRKDLSCIFTTAQQMSNKWLENFHTFNNYIEKVTNVSLLVIDDFGISEPPPGFLTFFMQVINTRMQWKNRGTIITTNLEIKKFNEFCGEALSDRIMTGQTFEFIGKTRRKKIIL